MLLEGLKEGGPVNHVLQLVPGLILDKEKTGNPIVGGHTNDKSEAFQRWSLFLIQVW